MQWLIPAAGVLALLFSFMKTKWVYGQSPGNETMIEIGRAVREGAMAFLKREYTVLSVFVVVVAVLLFVGNRAQEGGTTLVALSFLVGALASGLAGFIGMRVATAANNRTAHAAITSLQSALSVAFSGGAVMGMSVVGLGVIGLSSLFFLYMNYFGDTAEGLSKALTALAGFSLGASSIALFARVGGGIYTKAADVGATSSARWRRVSPRTIRGTPPRSRTTWATTWATSPAWAPTCSSPTWGPSSAPWCSPRRSARRP